MLVPWESHAENLGGGGQRARDKIKSDWVTGGHKTKKPPVITTGGSIEIYSSIRGNCLDRYLGTTPYVLDNWDITIHSPIHNKQRSFARRTLSVLYDIFNVSVLVQ